MDRLASDIHEAGAPAPPGCVGARGRGGAREPSGGAGPGEEKHGDASDAGGTVDHADAGGLRQLAAATGEARGGTVPGPWRFA